MFKKLIAAGFAVTLAASAAQAASEKVLIVGTEPTFAPFDYIENNELVGFDIDIINAIGEAAGFKVQMQSMQFDGLIPALLSGSIDCIISGFTKTEERAKRVDFSDGYYVAGTDLMIRAEDQGKIKSFNDLENHKVCVQLGSSGAVLAGNIKGAEVLSFNTMPEAYLELSKKGCDAAVTDTPVNLFYLVQTKDTNLVHVPESAVSIAEMGIATQKGNKEAMDLINRGLRKIRADGTYDKIYQKWFASAE